MKAHSSGVGLSDDVCLQGAMLTRLEVQVDGAARQAAVTAWCPCNMRANMGCGCTLWKGQQKLCRAKTMQDVYVWGRGLASRSVEVWSRGLESRSGLGGLENTLLLGQENGTVGWWQDVAFPWAIALQRRLTGAGLEGAAHTCGKGKVW